MYISQTADICENQYSLLALSNLLSPRTNAHILLNFFAAGQSKALFIRRFEGSSEMWGINELSRRKLNASAEMNIKGEKKTQSIDLPAEITGTENASIVFVSPEVLHSYFRKPFAHSHEYE